MSSQLGAAGQLLEWIKQGRGWIHPSLYLKLDPYTGLSIYTSTPLSPDERILSCPLSLTITPTLATRAICAEYDIVESELIMRDGTPWSEKILLAVYLVLHWIKPYSPNLHHQIYVDALPPPETLTSPLHFSDAELDLLEGTNLLGAVRDRKNELMEEAEIVREALKEPGTTWERYRDASFYVSSRAFPSSLLQIQNGTESDMILPGEISHPILVPGLDLLNHARGQAVTWLTHSVPSPDLPIQSINSLIPCISFIPHTPMPAHTQIYNNYGPKSNEEFLYAYGFVLPDGPDDTVILALGGMFKGNGKRYVIKRDGKLPEGLIRDIMGILSEEEEGGQKELDIDTKINEEVQNDQEDEIELRLYVLETIKNMLSVKLDKLSSRSKKENEIGSSIRMKVSDMCDEYRSGQKKVLELTIQRLEEDMELLEKRMEFTF
ncbi:hypothetical protein TREMEDRAFT_35092 [Tremella mesenterica DSM 1558]|uniref:uncharacterized protein n=1 Tax=Tremella mesenterica (strain ATCC 24925 / CBS 8224 / DSM 1558 / NBRC 9311 / NRRL Y-6157 / RJB 2259-6 / UBC 559-6) TaxID=578456 RepID=UPI00032C122C|nr:uncharacterized protein TREMEDRAFT_35092 [Tremella mesenterica DSM 1558]EIW66319.1 hypothetical protein TREMEDRAFT_35092 [Tremella mesenterica DSM 1558]